MKNSRKNLTALPGYFGCCQLSAGEFKDGRVTRRTSATRRLYGLKRSDNHWCEISERRPDSPAGDALAMNARETLPVCKIATRPNQVTSGGPKKDAGRAGRESSPGRER